MRPDDHAGGCRSSLGNSPVLGEGHLKPCFVGTGFGSRDTWLQKELSMALQKLEEREARVVISRKSSSTLWQAPSALHSLHWSFPLTYNVFYVTLSENIIESCQILLVPLPLFTEILFQIQTRARPDSIPKGLLTSP